MFLNRAQGLLILKGCVISCYNKWILNLVYFILSSVTLDFSKFVCFFVLYQFSEYVLIR